MAPVGRPRNPYGQGAKRGRPTKPKEFILKPGIPHPPDFVEADPLAFAEWIRVCEILDKEKRISDLFMISIALYCCKWADWAWVRAEIQDSSRGSTMIGANNKKRIVRNPWISYEQETFAQLMKAASEIGVTPLTSMKVESIPQTNIPGTPEEKKAASLDTFIEDMQ